MSGLARRVPDHYTIAELHAIATHALANVDDYARAVLREELELEEGNLWAITRSLGQRGATRRGRSNRVR